MSDKQEFRYHGHGLQEGESSLTEYDLSAVLSLIGLAIDNVEPPAGFLALLRSEGFDVYRASEKPRIGSHETGTGHFVSLWREESRIG